MTTHPYQTERAGANLSFWEATSDAGQLDPLRENTRADVCVVGAGIAGLSVAYTLVREGRSVVVIDDGLVGRGMTGRTTAHIVSALDDRYYEIEKLHGEEGSRLAAESHTAAIDFVERVVREEKIDCEFERLDGYLFEPPNEPTKNLREEFEACLRAGLAVEWVERAPIEAFDTGPAIQIPKPGAVSSASLFARVWRARSNAAAAEFLPARAQWRCAAAPMRMSTTQEGYAVQAGSVVVATNTPINDRFVIHTKQAPYTTYVIGVRVPKGSVTPGAVLGHGRARRAGRQGDRDDPVSLRAAGERRRR